MINATILRFDRSKGFPFVRKPIFDNAADVAETLAPEAPVFCFSSETLAGQAQKFLKDFPGEVAFAVKTNSSTDVISCLNSAGIGVWDVASVQEMAQVRKVTPHGTFHYHNPVKSRAEIAEAYTKYGCRRFAVDCDDELQKIAETVPHGGNVEIAVRFVLPRQSASSAHDFSSKFGASEAEAAQLLRSVAAMAYQPVLTFHPGSQCTDPEAYVRHIAAAARISQAANVALHTLNVGGGFPSDYVKSKGQDLRIYFAAIKSAAQKSFGGAGVPKLECEPGRGIAASCMSMLARVKLVKNSKDEIFLTDGVYGALMEVWQVPDLQPPHRVIRNGQVLDDSSRLVTVFGPTCDPLDKLPMKLSVPSDIREGDYIEFGALGAYGAATMTRFNGYGGHETVRVRSVLQT